MHLIPLLRQLISDIRDEDIVDRHVLPGNREAVILSP